MAIKIENQSTTKLPPKTLQIIEAVLKAVPRDHLRGIDRVRIVDAINDPRLRLPTTNTPPGLYHPKQGNQTAWLEIAASALVSKSQPLHKRFMQRLSFKGNLAAILFSLVGQHYHLTMRHSVKRSQLEGSIRAYTENHLRLWSERESSFRSRLFKPFQPTLERWAQSLKRRAKEEEKRAHKKPRAKST